MDLLHDLGEVTTDKRRLQCYGGRPLQSLLVNRGMGSRARRKTMMLAGTAEGWGEVLFRNEAGIAQGGTLPYQKMG